MEGHFRLGPWLVQPNLDAAVRNGTTNRLTPKAMKVLVCLAEHTGKPVAKEELLRAVWPDTFVTDDVLKGSIAELRRVLGDDAKEPRFIQTIAKRGYRLIAPVEWVNREKHSAAEQPKPEVIRAPVVRSRKIWMASTVVSGSALLFVLLGLFNVADVRTRLRTGAGPEIRSIAVLPLRNLSSDPNQEYFSDGLTDELITDLAHITSLKVISHTSTIQYKDAKRSLPEIARELNVDGIIEGTVQRSGDRVRITAQLIDGPSDKHLWANSYERDVRDVFALEQDVTEDISRQVRARIEPYAQKSPPQPRPINPKALDAYLEGNYHLGRYGEGSGGEEQKQAAQYFQQAIDADPNFAPAYDGLASAHNQLVRASSEDVAIEKAAAAKAVELDPNFADARVTLGFLKWQPDLDWRGAETQFRQAIALSPNNASAHDLLGFLLVTMGRTQEALREGQIAQQLDPHNDHLSLILYHARDYDGSIRMALWMLRQDPKNGNTHCLLWGDYFKKEMYREAIDELSQCYSLYGYPKVGSNLQKTFAASGYRGAMRQFAKDIEHLQAANQVYLPGNLVVAYTILGDKNLAFYWLEQAYEHREMVSIDGGVFMMGSEPMLDALRSDPRFKDMLRRVGLPP